jgi:phage shock protein PspC (stress-responsive transcriptional regulator)
MNDTLLVVLAIVTGVAMVALYFVALAAHNKERRP